MPTGTLISVEEYLATSYRPDCDYVDGRLVERNVGERDHSSLHAALSSFLFSRRKQWGIQVFVEQRIQVRPQRYRVPDICVIVGVTDEQILTKPPFLCIEILSPEDRLSRVKERIDDYLAMGVPHVWLLDPRTRQAYAADTMQGFREIKDRVLRIDNPAIEVPIDQLFE